MSAIITVNQLNKTYAGGHQALRDINLSIKAGEIFALLGPNGAGKTTLISAICGLVNPSAGEITVAGHDVVRNFRQARAMIGLVPQELHTDAFETVWATLRFSRGLFGCPPDDARLEGILRTLSLWDKRHARIMTLSGGMKRRVMIAKALSHEPRVLFLDEPTAGVDVELRQDMWQVVRQLRDQGVTIILTTHYIEEAEEMADRIGIINNGKLVLVEDKTGLMEKLGRKELTLTLQKPLDSIPAGLDAFQLALSDDQLQLHYRFDAQQEQTGIAKLMRELDRHGIDYRDLHSHQSSLEEIFVGLIREQRRQSTQETSS